MSCFMDNIQMLPLSVAARSDAWFCGCLHAGISVSSPAGSMDFFYVFLEVSATGRSLVQRSHTECDVSNYFDRGKSKRRSRPTIGFRAMRKIFKYCFEFNRIFFPPHFARFEIPTAVLLMSEVFCDVTPCYWVSKSRLSEWLFCLILLSQAVWFQHCDLRRISCGNFLHRMTQTTDLCQYIVCLSFFFIEVLYENNSRRLGLCKSFTHFLFLPRIRHFSMNCVPVTLIFA